jgi:hypothetical protein
VVYSQLIALNEAVNRTWLNLGVALGVPIPTVVDVAYTVAKPPITK